MFLNSAGYQRSVPKENHYWPVSNREGLHQGGNDGSLISCFMINLVFYNGLNALKKKNINYLHLLHPADYSRPSGPV